MTPNDLSGIVLHSQNARKIVEGWAAQKPCDHTWAMSIYNDYAICYHCGTFMSTTAPKAEEIYTAEYWTHENGHSTPEEQVYNCNEYQENGLSKTDFVLGTIRSRSRYKKAMVQNDIREACGVLHNVLEVGCSPGAILRKLAETESWGCIHGIDKTPLAESQSEVIFAHPSGDVIEAFFPDRVTRTTLQDRFYSLVIGCDVFEHSHEPQEFLEEAARVTDDGGQIILMAPIVELDEEEMPERMFAPIEHVYLHSARNLAAMLNHAGYERIQFSRWCPGHEVVTANRKTRKAK